MILSKQDSKGFTLIEVMVVIIIIGILATLVLANYKTSSSGSELQYAVQRLAGEIKKAQNMAMSSYKYKEGATEEVPCGYGVHFESNNSYFLWRDLARVSGDSSCATSDKEYNAGEKIGQDINLPNNINLSFESVDIFFMPPDPEVFFDGDEMINSTSMEVWDIGSPGNKKIISVNQFGLVEVN